MTARRTDARYRWLMSAIQLLLFVGFRYKAKQHADVDREDLSPEDSPATAFWAGASESSLTARLSPIHLSGGFIRAVLYETAYDCDLWGLRHSRRRRFLVNSTTTVVIRRVVSRSPESTFSLELGGAIGRLLYRTRYGLLGEPRGD